MLQSFLPGAAEVALAVAAGWALTYLLHSTAILVLAWLLAGRTPLTRSPRARSALWIGAVVASLASATLQTGLGVGAQVPLEASESEKVVAEFRPSAGAESAEAAAASSATGVTTSVHRPHRSVGLEPVAWYRSIGHDWPFLLSLVWLSGAAFLLARCGPRVRRLRSTLDGRDPVRSGPARRELDDLAFGTGLDRPVRLSRCAGIAGPVALPGREICLPDRALEELDREALRAVLAHELAHVARRDTLVLLSLEAVRRLLFFQPLLGLARRRAERAAEDRSDRWVRDLGLGAPLADGLLSVARWLRAGNRGIRMAGLGRSLDLDERIRRLLQAPSGPAASPTPPATALAAGGALALLLLFAAPAARVSIPAHPSVIEGAGGARPTGTETATATDPGDLGAVVGARPDGADDLRPRLRELLDDPGGTLLVRLDGAGGSASFSLRPGGREVRLVSPGGREVRLAPPEPAAGGWAASIQVPSARPGRYELHLPGSVARLGLEVDGVTTREVPRPPGAELPRLIPLP